jgi:hypothetical protein
MDNSGGARIEKGAYKGACYREVAALTPVSLILPMLALVIAMEPAAAASVRETDLRVECHTKNVPDDQVADCVAALKDCMKSKTLKQCEADIFSEATPD